MLLRGSVAKIFDISVDSAYNKIAKVNFKGLRGLNRTPPSTNPHPKPLKTPSARKSWWGFRFYSLTFATSSTPEIAAGFPKVPCKARAFKARQIES
jgi:hypothetical protein